MEFVPKRAVDLTSEKLSIASTLSDRLTDINPGSVLRTLFEADSIAEEELDHRMYQGLVDGIATELYTAFDFDRLPAVPASGVQTFVRGAGISVTIDVPIPQGTQVASPATSREPTITYATTEAATLPAGALSVDVPVRATVGGLVSNAPAHAVSTIVSTLYGVAATMNAAAYQNGADEESDSARLARFAQWVSNLRGGTLEGLEANALGVMVTDSEGVVTERVQYARAIDSYVAGRVDVYVDNGGGDASEALRTAVLTKLVGATSAVGVRTFGYKAGGIVVRVFATTGVPVAVTGQLKIEAGYVFADVATAVQDAVTLYLYGLGVFGELIYADLLAIIVQTEGVRDVTLTTPTANRTPAFEERLMPGLLTFTEWV